MYNIYTYFWTDLECKTGTLVTVFSFYGELINAELTGTA